MLNFRKIRSEDFHGIYHDMLEQFPLAELKDFQTFADLIDTGAYDAIIAEEDGVPVGYCLVFKSEKYIFLDYIAIFKIRQGKGFGGEILDMLRDYYLDKDGCFLEEKNYLKIFTESFRTEEKSWQKFSNRFFRK